MGAGAVCAVIGLAGCAQTPDSAQSASPAVSELNTQSLLGATPATLDAEFGQPDLRRVDGTAQVWLYQSSVCGLNLILYPDSSGTPRVAAAVQNDGNAPSCMSSLQHGVTDAALEPPSSS
jgi:hypothetical protein